jgi:hypothetical protein
MTDPTTLGPYLRSERERRGLTLRTISESTKVSVGLLEGLEANDISRWPGGIFRRAFVRSYAQCIGLDADDVMRRFERQFPGEAGETLDPIGALNGSRPSGSATHAFPGRPSPEAGTASTRTRLLGTAADLAVAAVLAFACAAAGSRLLWPVLLIACYYAAGVLISGTSPMVALLSEARAKSPAPEPQHIAEVQDVKEVEHAEVAAQAAAAAPVVAARPAERRHQGRRPGDRQVRHRRGAQARA